MEFKSALASSTLKIGVLPRFDDMGRTFDRRCRVSRNDLADYQVIKEHLYGGQMLLDRLRRTRVLFDVGRDVHRRDEPEIVNVLFTPGQKLAAGASVSFAGIQVPDPGREKFQELRCRVLAGVGQDRRNGMSVAEG